MIVLLVLLCGAAAAFAIGYLWPRTTKVRPARAHHRADGLYYEVHIANQSHWFTEEQVAVARARAVKMGDKP